MLNLSRCVCPPLTSAIRQSLPRVQYLDAYALPLPTVYPATAVARALFAQAPAWVRGLLWLRNAVVRRLGLRATTAAGPRPATGPLHPGDRLGLFQIFTVTPAEVLLGLDDRHPDFRVSVLVEAAAAGPATAWVSTAVQYHNALGRWYFALVRPFHGLVVRALLRAGRNRLATACPPLTPSQSVS